MCDNNELDLEHVDTENDSILIASLKLKRRNKMLPSKKKKKEIKCKPRELIPSRSKASHSKVLTKAREESQKKVFGLDVLQEKHTKKKKNKMDPPWTKSPIRSIQETCDFGESLASTRKQKRKRRQKHKLKLDEPSRLQRRSKYLLIKMKLEQNLIDAYAGEGWKGQSREKIKPEKELIRAKKQILLCKIALRDVIRQLDSLSSIGSIDDSFMAPDGRVSHEHIFCAKCKMNEVSPDNDIVLCDGRCNCAFHQKCLDPPLQTENIPPGDQGWLCKFCDCRIEIIEAINAHLGTQFSINSNWEDMFKDEAAYPDGGNILSEALWPSDDSADDDYDPQQRASYISGSGTYDDSTDGATCSTSMWSSSEFDAVSESINRGSDHRHPKDFPSCSHGDSDATSEGEILFSRRQRRNVDYKKLYNEMFGKNVASQEQLSDDEDWGPPRRKCKEKESDAASTLMNLHKSEGKGKEVESFEIKYENSQMRKSLFRFSTFAVEKLRQAFAENELPSKRTREHLAKELGLEIGKITKWFKNSRYLALKSRKVDGLKDSCNPIANSISKSNFKAISSTSASDASAEMELFTLKNFKDAILKKRAKLTSCSNKKTTGQNHNLNKEMEHYVGVNTKKRLKRRKRKRTDKSVPAKVAESDLEKVYRTKNRLEAMSSTLLALSGSSSSNINGAHVLGHGVIFVPVAELREKLTFLGSCFK